MAKTRRHSSLTDNLPSEVMAQVNRLLIEPATTYDDVKTWLEGQGYDISRSAIGRYGKDFFAEFQRQRMVEEQAKALVSDAEENGLILEEAAAKVFARKIFEGVMSGSLDIQKMPRIISDFAKLQSSSIQRERLKSEYAKKAEKAAESVVDEVQKLGLSEAGVERIRRKILGIAE